MPKQKIYTVSNIDYNPTPQEIGYTNLVIAVIAQAVEEDGIEYLESDDCAYWLELINIDKEKLLKRLVG